MPRLHRLFALPVLAALVCLAGNAAALTLDALAPAEATAVPLAAGSRWRLDAAGTIGDIPPALAGATLVRIPGADAAAGGVSFVSDAQAEVYACLDPRSATPRWLDGWVKTGMTLGVKGDMIDRYDVWARRFPAGAVTIPAPAPGEAAIVAVSESVPKRRRGWIFLSWDLPYLREMIRRAPEYGITQIQLSHEIMMNAAEVLEDQPRRAAVNELIDLAHAYGVPEVLLWTHEIDPKGLPKRLRAPADHPAAGHADGNNPELWTWLAARYVSLFSAAKGCPQADGVVLTFSEVGDRVYRHEPGLPEGEKPGFKHDGFTPAQSVAQVVNVIRETLKPLGKTLYARTWGDSFNKWEEPLIRDGIKLSADPYVWIMNKNVGGIDWPYMDTPQSLTGSLGSRFNELMEFDLGFEYYDHSQATCCMTSYLKQNWARALAKGVDGAAVRIDRAGGFAWFSPNRLNLYAFSRILDDPQADPAAINLEWCRRQFPPEAFADIAASYDDPDTPRAGDTRYLTWKAYFPKLAPIGVPEAKAIAAKALERIERQRALLEKQTTLDTRGGRTDYETLRDGIARPLKKLIGKDQK